jgi:hypothetical protein
MSRPGVQDIRANGQTAHEILNDGAIPRDWESELRSGFPPRTFFSSLFRKGGLEFSPHIRQTADDTPVYGARTILATVGSVKYAG